MSKSDKRKNRSAQKPAPEELTIVEIDEAVFGRLSETFQKSEKKVNNFLGSLKGVHLIEEDELDSAIEEMLARYDLESEEEFENRIELVLGGDNIEVGDKTLKIYLDHLKKRVSLPCLLTGSEEFEWEEYYSLGLGSQKEYEKLKKTRPSYTDKFKLIGFNEYINEVDGILVEAQRVTDNKKFTLPLSYLEAIDEASANAELLDDYAVWFVNYK